MSTAVSGRSLASRLFAASALLALLASLVFSLLLYRTVLGAEMRRMDDKLVAGAAAIAYIVGETFHDQRPAELADERGLNAALTRYQHDAGLANLYSVMLANGQPEFRASSWVTGDDGQPVEESWYLRAFEVQREERVTACCASRWSRA